MGKEYFFTKRLFSSLSLCLDSFCLEQMRLIYSCRCCQTTVTYIQFAESSSVSLSLSLAFRYFSHQRYTSITNSISNATANNKNKYSNNDINNKNNNDETKKALKLVQKGMKTEKKLRNLTKEFLRAARSNCSEPKLSGVFNLL